MWRSKNILLIEHDPDDRFIIERALKSADEPFTVVPVESAAAAELHLRSGGARPAIVLLDLDLPMESGFAFLDWMRRTEGLNSLRIIVLASSNRFRDIRRAFDRGADGYFVKRMEFDELPRLIQETEALDDVWWGARAQGLLRNGRTNSFASVYSDGYANDGMYQGLAVRESNLRQGKG